MRAARLFNEESMARAAASGLGLRPAHARLLPHLSFDGVRLTDLAERAGITKQSAAALVDDMVAAGFLKKEPDPGDGRAKLVRYTPQGLAAVNDGLAILGELEAEMRDRVGDGEVDALDRGLTALLVVLDRDAGGER